MVLQPSSRFRRLPGFFVFALLLLPGCSLFGKGGIGQPPSSPEGNSTRETPEGNSKRGMPEGNSQGETPEGSSPALPRPILLARSIESHIPPMVQFRGEERYARLSDRMAALKVPALSIAVFENFKLVWAQAYGFADASQKLAATTETLFQAASISKPVNALTLLRAVNQKGISMEAPINAHLRSWKIPKHEWSETKPVTIQQLLSHTGGTTVHGFAGYPRGSSFPTTLQILNGETPSNSSPVLVTREPGTGVRYSGGGITISQLLVEDMFGKDYAELAKTLTLNPLHMERSSFAQPLDDSKLKLAASAHDHDGRSLPGHSHVYPEKAAAGLWTTPTDLAKFFIAIAKASAGQASSVTAQEAKFMTSLVVSDPATGNAVSHGLFMSTVNGKKMFGHGGSNLGFRCNAMASLSDGFGYVIMTNGENGEELIGEVRRALMSEPGWPGGFETLKRVEVPEGLASSFVGLYGTGNLDSFSLSASSAGLRLKRPFEEPRELVFVGRGRFVDPKNRSFISIDSNGGPLELTAQGERVQQIEHLARPDKSPLWLLDQGSTKTAVEAWHRLTLGFSSEKLGAFESQLNNLGYALASKGRWDEAHRVLLFVTQVRPKSWNALDSLGEIEMKRGQMKPALVRFRGALELLRADGSLDKGSKEVIAKRLRKTIADLRRASSKK